MLEFECKGEIRFGIAEEYGMLSPTVTGWKFDWTRQIYDPNKPTKTSGPSSLAGSAGCSGSGSPLILTFVSR